MSFQEEEMEHLIKINRRLSDLLEFIASKEPAWVDYINNELEDIYHVYVQTHK